LVYNEAHTDPGKPPISLVRLLSPSGETLLRNEKKHPAPGEAITPGNHFSSALIQGKTVSADICYDLHYIDIARRLSGVEYLFAPVDDERYGGLLPFFHAADVVFRAAYNHTAIVTAATTGPTMFVRANGTIAALLPLHGSGVLQIDELW
jgi:apolipoprotein N-acyltransferase